MKLADNQDRQKISDEFEFRSELGVTGPQSPKLILIDSQWEECCPGHSYSILYLNLRKKHVITC